MSVSIRVASGVLCLLESIILLQKPSYASHRIYHLLPKYDMAQIYDTPTESMIRLPTLLYALFDRVLFI